MLSITAVRHLQSMTKIKVKLTFPILLDYDPESSLEHDLNVEFYHPDKPFSYISDACPLSVLCSVIASYCSAAGSGCTLDTQNF